RASFQADFGDAAAPLSQESAGCACKDAARGAICHRSCVCCWLCGYQFLLGEFPQGDWQFSVRVSERTDSEGLIVRRFVRVAAACGNPAKRAAPVLFWPVWDRA